MLLAFSILAVMEAICAITPFMPVMMPFGWRCHDFRLWILTLIGTLIGGSLHIYIYIYIYIA